MRRGLVRNALAILTWGLVAGLVAQVFLAGLGVLRSPADFATHRDWGYLLEVVVLVIAIIAGLLRLGRRIVVLALVMFALFLLQSVLINFRATTPELAALHPVNGFLIVLVAIGLARETWRVGGLTEQ